MKNYESRMAVIPPEKTGGKPVKVWAVQKDEYSDKWIPDLEESTYLLACQVARLPFIFSHIALMPDAHFGKGVPIGCVLPAENAVIPNAVGVDIGCGMSAWNSGVHISDINISDLMKEWKELIPVGEGKAHDQMSPVISDKFFTEKADKLAAAHQKMKEEFGSFEEPPVFDRFRKQLGTLGGGNHFVELQVDSNGIAWVMIHSGSRGYGANTAKQHHNVAKLICSKYFSKLETVDLAYLPADSKEGQYYIRAMTIAQDFAMFNRDIMMRSAQRVIRDQIHKTNPLNEYINIHHNYASLENHFGKNIWVHRKGATLARKNTVGIIPGAMTTKSYIVNGKGSEHSFQSCSHGSGRLFSRTEAKRRIQQGTDPSQESQLQKAKVTLHGTKEAHDELGSAYKDINTVISNQQDLVDIKTELIPIAVLKG